MKKVIGTYLLRSFKNVQLYKQVTCASTFLSSNDSVIHDYSGSKVIYCCSKDTDYRLETVQDFLFKLDIKPLMHLLEISTYLLTK